MKHAPRSLLAPLASLVLALLLSAGPAAASPARLARVVATGWQRHQRVQQRLLDQLTPEAVRAGWRRHQRGVAAGLILLELAHAQPALAAAPATQLATTAAATAGVPAHVQQLPRGMGPAEPTLLPADFFNRDATGAPILAPSGPRVEVTVSNLPPAYRERGLPRSAPAVFTADAAHVQAMTVFAAANGVWRSAEGWLGHPIQPRGTDKVRVKVVTGLMPGVVGLNAHYRHPPLADVELDAKQLPVGSRPGVHDARRLDYPISAGLMRRVTAHEVTHQLLDALMGFDPLTYELIAVHEGTADVGAILDYLGQPSVARKVLAQTRGDLRRASFASAMLLELNHAARTATSQLSARIEPYEVARTALRSDWARYSSRLSPEARELLGGATGAARLPSNPLLVDVFPRDLLGLRFQHPDLLEAELVAAGKRIGRELPQLRAAVRARLARRAADYLVTPRDFLAVTPYRASDGPYERGQVLSQTVFRVIAERVASLPRGSDRLAGVARAREEVGRAYFRALEHVTWSQETSIHDLAATLVHETEPELRPLFRRALEQRLGPQAGWAAAAAAHHAAVRAALARPPG